MRSRTRGNVRIGLKRLLGSSKSRGITCDGLGSARGTIRDGDGRRWMEKAQAVWACAKVKVKQYLLQAERQHYHSCGAKRPGTATDNNRCYKSESAMRRFIMRSESATEEFVVVYPSR